MGDLTNNLSRYEVECPCGCGFDTIDYKVVRMVQDAADYFDAFIGVNSGCRCLDYNRTKDSKDTSQHVKGRAIDFYLYKLNGDGIRRMVPPDMVYAYLDARYPNRHGLGKYGSFTHVDSRKEKVRW